MTTQPTIDQAKTEAFLGKVLSDTSGMTTTILASIGDRLGLFTNLAHGPATSTELANRAEINERYAREWLGAMASAGYVVYDPASERFTLPEWRTVPRSTNATHANGLAPWRVRATWSMTRQVNASRYRLNTCLCWRRKMVPSSSGACIRC